jgi:hypothetical protein
MAASYPFFPVAAAARRTAAIIRWYGTAAQVSVQAVGDLCVRGLRVGLEQRHRLEHHARRTVAALDGAFVEKRLLDRVQRPALGETFDSDDLAALGRAHRRHARHCRGAVEKHGTRSALTFAAAVFRSGQPQVFAQNFQEGPLRLRIDTACLSIDQQPDGRHVINPSFNSLPFCR